MKDIKYKIIETKVIDGVTKHWVKVWNTDNPKYSQDQILTDLELENVDMKDIKKL
jgi:hypothetical protein